jgi:hypothetical protein
MGKPKWVVAILGALAVLLLMKILPAYPSVVGAVPASSPSAFVVAAAVEPGRSVPVRSLACTGTNTTTLTVTRGTLIRVSCPFAVSWTSSSDALVSAGRAPGILYIVANRVGKGVIQIHHGTIRITVRR